MNSAQLKKHDRLSRVHDHSIASPEHYPANSRRAQLLAVITAAIAEVRVQAAAQATSFSLARESTINKKAASTALRKRLQQISGTAQTMATSVPGIAAQFRLPNSKSDQVLVNVARSFVTNATPLEAEFVKSDLTADFLTQVGTEIDRLEQAITAKHHHTQAHVTATAAINAALARGLKALRQLDQIMRNTLQGDEVMLATWTSVSRAERHTRKDDPEKPPAPPSAP